jgi:CRISPR-associated protein Csm3
MTDSTGKIIKKIFVQGKIITQTGLHIGGSDIGIAVGSTDNVVIRDPITNQPYIPGSSLKGKMRSLLEKIGSEEFSSLSKQIANGPVVKKGSIAAKLFGVPAEVEDGMPSRVIVRDGKLLNPEFLEKAKTDMPYTEIKTEVVIDRITSAANPRQVERVPVGAEFELSLILNIYEEDEAKKKSEGNDNEETKLLEALMRSLRLVQDDYLGGYGTRGSGQVKFAIESIKEKNRNCYETNGKASSYKDESKLKGILSLDS